MNLLQDRKLENFGTFEFEVDHPKRKLVALPHFQLCTLELIPKNPNLPLLQNSTYIEVLFGSVIMGIGLLVHFKHEIKVSHFPQLKFRSFSSIDDTSACGDTQKNKIKYNIIMSNCIMYSGSMTLVVEYQHWVNKSRLVLA